MTLKLKLLPLLALPLLAAGCGGNVSRLKTHPVEGSVQFEGRPLEGAFVVLHPKGLSDPKFLPAHAQTDAAGKFKATTYDAHDGAIAGEYSITVEFNPLVQTDDGVTAGPNLLPPKYASRETTDLTTRVAEGENKIPLINITR
jgi:hypothetical protein